MADFRDFRSTHVGQYFGLLETFPWSQNENVLFKKKKSGCHLYCLLYVPIHWVLREINQSDNELKWKSSFASIFTQRRILQKAENRRKNENHSYCWWNVFLMSSSMWLKEKQFGLNQKFKIRCISNLVIGLIRSVTSSDCCSGLALKCILWIIWYLNGEDSTLQVWLIYVKWWH